VTSKLDPVTFNPCYTFKAIHEYPLKHQMTCVLGYCYWFLFCCIYQSERYIIRHKGLMTNEQTV